MPRIDSSCIHVYGDAIEGVAYTMRPGGYAVIRRADGDMAIAQTLSGFYLPGGGQEDGESPEQAAVREAYEECGLRIRVLDRIGTADQRAYSVDYGEYYRKRCVFVNAELVAEEGGGEDDHTLVWMRPDDAVDKLSHESQRRAVVTSLRLAAGDDHPDDPRPGL